MKPTNYLSTIGRVTTPAAMVVFMSYEINRSMQVTGAWAWAVLIGAVLTSFGVEIVGILSGHTMEGFWRIGNTNKSILSFTLLSIYTFAAVYILRNNTTLLPIPVVAAIVYIVSALADSLNIEETKQDTVKGKRDSFNLEQEAKDRELARQLKVADTRLKHEERMAKLQIPLSVVSNATQRNATRNERGMTPKQQAMANSFQPGISPTELARKAGVDKSTASRYITNGAMKHWQLTNGGGEQ